MMSKQFVILIADDSKIQRKILRDILSSWDYVVHEAIDGKQALKLFTQVQPDLVILDGVMPEMDGYTACAYLQELWTDNKTPVLLITAHDNQLAVDRAFAAGAEEYLTKPIQWNILKYRLQRILAAQEAKRALQNSQERIKLVLEAGTDAFWDWNLRTGRLEFGAQSLNLLGYSEEKETLEISEWWGLVNPDDKVKVIRRFKTHVRGLTDKYEAEHRLLTKSGDWKWVWSRGKVVEYDLEGKPLRIIGVITDIDIRKRAYEALLSSEEKLQGIFNNAVAGIGMIDPQGKCIYANKKWAEMLGYSVEELYQMSYADYTYAEDYPESKYLLEQTGNNVIREYHIKKRYMRKDGSVFWANLSASAVYREDKSLQFIIGVMVDITQLQTETEKLRASEKRLEETQHIARLGSWEFIVDTQQHIWSAETFRIFGLTPQEQAPVFEEYLRLVHPDDKSWLLHSLRKTFKEPIPYAIEIRFRQPDGSYKYTVMRGQPVLVNGRVKKLAGSILDITERKQVEVQIQRNNDVLLALNNISIGLLNRLDINEVLAMIVKHVAGLFGNASASLYLLKDDGAETELRFALGLAEKYIGYTIAKDQGLVGKVFASGKTYIVDNYRQWENKLPDLKFDVPFPVIGLPLLSSGKVVGVVTIILNEVGRKFALEEQILLERFAELASIAYDNASLYNQAQREIGERKMIEEKLRYISLHDYLTGLYNRTYFEQELDGIDKNSDGTIGIIMCDIDGLKYANDTLGHACGDQLIRAAGEVLQSSFLPEDVVARIGGDEFAVLMKSADEQTVKAACLRIHERLAQYPAIQGIQLKMSIGWSVGDKHGDARNLLKLADQYMYREKLGRERKN